MAFAFGHRTVGVLNLLSGAAKCLGLMLTSACTFTRSAVILNAGALSVASTLVVTYIVHPLYGRPRYTRLHFEQTGYARHAKKALGMGRVAVRTFDLGHAC
jgi:hypothetical protein